MKHRPGTGLMFRIPYTSSVGGGPTVSRALYGRGTAGSCCIMYKRLSESRFQWPRNLETVCLLVLRNPVTHVNIDVDVEELVQDKHGMATYDQIRDYVKEQTGLHVTNLNIAQIKRKCGITQRENYNLPKSEDSRQPNCTNEKENAIKEAFKHFGMINR